MAAFNLGKAPVKLLHRVFSYSGLQDWLYIAPVCRRWAAVYKHQASKAETSYRSALESLSHVEAAAQTGLPIHLWQSGTAFGYHFSLSVGRYADVPTLQWLTKHGAGSTKGTAALPCFEAICIGATRAGRLRTLQWLRRSRQVTDSAFVKTVAHAAVAHSGTQPILNWLFDAELLTTSYDGGLPDAAAAAGNAEALQWLMSKGFLDCLTEETLNAAARSGAVLAVRFLLSFHCPCSAHELGLAAAESDSVELLQFLQARRTVQWNAEGIDAMMERAAAAGASAAEAWLKVTSFSYN